MTESSHSQSNLDLLRHANLSLRRQLEVAETITSLVNDQLWSSGSSGKSPSARISRRPASGRLPAHGYFGRLASQMRRPQSSCPESRGPTFTCLLEQLHHARQRGTNRSLSEPGTHGQGPQAVVELPPVIISREALAGRGFQVGLGG